MKNYAVIIIELDYKETEPYEQYEKTVTLYGFYQDGAEATQIAEYLQRQKPLNHMYQVIEVGKVVACLH